MTTDPVPLPTRQAALLAHGLPAHDRDWLLGHLEPAQRGLLAGLLRELQTLAIPPDHELLEQVLRDHRPASLLTGTQCLERLDAQGIADLVTLLQGEPPRLAARVLAMRAWPWRAEVAATLRAADSTLDSDAQADAAPVLDEALADELAAALAGRAGSGAPVKAGGRWMEIFRRRAP